METIKAHPGIAIGAAVVGIIAIWYLMSSSGATQTIQAGPDQSAVAAGTQLQMSQVQAGAQLQGLHDQLQYQASHDSSVIELAKVNNSAAINNNQIIAEVESQKVQAGLEAGKLASTLNAQVQIANVNAGVAKEQSQVAAYTTLADINQRNTASMYGYLTAQTYARANDNSNCLFFC